MHLNFFFATHLCYLGMSSEQDRNYRTAKGYGRTASLLGFCQRTGHTYFLQWKDLPLYADKQWEYIEILLHESAGPAGRSPVKAIAFYVYKNQSPNTAVGQVTCTGGYTGLCIATDSLNCGQLASRPQYLLGLSVNAHFLFWDVGHYGESGQVSVSNWHC